MPSFAAARETANGGIDITDNENQVWFAFDKNRLNAFQNFSSLRCVGARADFQVHVRRGDAHLAEENVGKFFIIVLAGVNKDGLDFRMALHLTHERRDFREVRARPDDIENFQVLAHGAFASGIRMHHSIRELSVRCNGFAIRAKKALVQCVGIGIRRETWVK